MGRHGLITTIETDANGEAHLHDYALPVGDYELVEHTPPTGYLDSGITNQLFRIPTTAVNGHRENLILDPERHLANDVIRGGVEIEKVDRELSFVETLLSAFGIAQGDGSLEGIHFDITNTSDNRVLVDGVWYEPGERVARITTAYETLSGELRAVARTSNRLLPYGEYSIQEVESNSTYHLTDGEPRTFRIETDGEMVTGTIDGTT